MINDEIIFQLAPLKEYSGWTRRRSTCTTWWTWPETSCWCWTRPPCLRHLRTRASRRLRPTASGVRPIWLQQRPTPRTGKLNWELFLLHSSFGGRVFSFSFYLQLTTLSLSLSRLIFFTDIFYQPAFSFSASCLILVRARQAICSKSSLGRVRKKS